MDLYHEVDANNQEMIVTSLSSANAPIVVLNTPEAVSEFLKVDSKVAIKYMVLDIEAFGMFFENGPQMIKNKAIFNEIFKLDNLKKMTPHLLSVMEKHTDALASRCSTETWTEIDAKEGACEIARVARFKFKRQGLAGAFIV